MSAEDVRELGKVKLIQVQPSGLIVDTPSGSYYDASRRVEVEELIITPLGIEARNADGEHVLDIHHKNHPDKAYDDVDLISIGFTSHYAAIRKRFGKHMEDGTAGENIIIECDQEVWLDDLGEQIAIEHAETGDQVLLNVLSFARPCEEFSHFADNRQHEELPAAELKDTLQFLDRGRRGFLLVMSAGQDVGTVRVGDRVFAIHDVKS